MTYQTAGFVDKNKDLVWKDLLEVGSLSSLSVCKTMFPPTDTKITDKKRPETAGFQFKTQVNKLMEQLSLCTPHYIRCIKSNDNKRSGEFNVDRVLHQVQYLGLLENVRVRRAGFAFRMEFARFMKQYKMICRETWPHWSGDEASAVRTVLQSTKMTEGSEFQIGTSKVFIRAPQSVFILEDLRERRLNELAILIQKVYKAWKVRKYFLELREKALGLYEGKKLRRKVSVKLFYLGDYVNDGKHKQILSLLAK